MIIHKCDMCGKELGNELFTTYDYRRTDKIGMSEHLYNDNSVDLCLECMKKLSDCWDSAQRTEDIENDNS